LLDTDPSDSSLRERVKATLVTFGSYTNALRLVDKDLQNTPSNLEALVQKSLLCIRLGDFSNAIPPLTHALSLTNSYTLRLYRANTYLRMGQLDNAAADYEEALRAFPGSSDPCYGLGDVAERRGDMNRAKEYRLAGISNALVAVDERLKSTPNNIQALADKAALLLQAGDFSNAIPVLTSTLRLTNTFSLWYYRANARLQIGQFKEAKEDYEKALSAAPRSSEPYYGLAEVAARKGETNLATQYRWLGVSNALLVLGEQLQRTPDNVSLLMDKGVLLSRAGKFVDSIPVFDRVLSLTNIYQGRLFRALAYLETQQLDAAEADCRELLRLFPSSYQPYTGLAEIDLRRGNTNAAIQNYQRYLSVAPTNQVEFQQIAVRLKSLQSQAQ
jgi:tetratricopeptide (TPR) repeat protein